MTVIMKKSIPVIRKPGRPATGVDPMVSVRLPAEHINLLDQVAKKEGRSRSETIREAVSDWLAGLGLLKP